MHYTLLQGHATLRGTCPFFSLLTFYNVFWGSHLVPVYLSFMRRYQSVLILSVASVLDHTSVFVDLRHGQEALGDQITKDIDSVIPGRKFRRKKRK